MALPILNSSRYEMTIPSTGQEITYRPYLVKEEKILMIAMESQDTKLIYTAIKDVIKSCVFEKLDIDKLAIFDIEALFLSLRSKSVGESVNVRLKCDDCEHKNDSSINFDDIVIPKIDENDKVIQLTRDGVGVVMKYPSLTDIEKLSSKEMSKVDTMYELIYKCLDTIFDAENIYPIASETKKDVAAFIDSLNSDQFKKIANFFNDLPSISAEIDFECSKCGKKNTMEVKGLQSFFT